MVSVEIYIFSSSNTDIYMYRYFKKVYMQTYLRLLNNSKPLGGLWELKVSID